MDTLACKLYRCAYDGDYERVAQMAAELKGSKRVSDLNWAFSGACEQGHLKCAKKLFSMGADNLSEGFKLACEHNHGHVITWIYIETPCLDLNWALFGAAQGGHIARVKWLVQIGAYMFDQSAYIASSNNHASIVRYLLECGATNISQCFVVACMRGHEEIAGEMMNASIVDIHSGFLQACSHGHIGIVKMCTRSKYTLPWLVGALRAQLSGHEKIVTTLMEYGQNL